MRKKLEEILADSNKRRIARNNDYKAGYKTSKTAVSKMKLGNLGKENIV